MQKRLDLKKMKYDQTKYDLGLMDQNQDQDNQQQQKKIVIQEIIKNYQVHVK